MDHENRHTGRNFLRLAPLVAVVTTAASLFGLSATAGAGGVPSNPVSAVSGSAFGEHTDVNITGLGPVTSGPTPSVTLPSSGGVDDDSLPSGILVPPFGPVGVFVTATGPLTAHTDGTVGPAGAAMSSASVAGLNLLGGVVTSSLVQSACTSDASGSSGSTTLARRSKLIQNKTTTVNLSTSPAPNTTYQGKDNRPGSSKDTFTAIFNEQITTAGGGNTGITVNAVHLILHGPTATGDIVIGQSHCDSTVPCTPISGNVTGPVVVNRGQFVCYVDATVTGGITVKPGGEVSVTSSTVNGGITSSGATGFTLCDSNVPGTAGPSVKVTGTTGTVVIGDPPTCLGNTIGGSVQLTNNAGGVVFRNNFVGGNATIGANTGGPLVVGNNYITGALGCTTNNPAPVNGGQPNTVGSATFQCIGV